MGKKHCRQRKHILFCLAGCLTALFILSNCTHYGLEKWKPEEHLELSRHYMSKGDFKGSLEECQKAYDLYPRSLGDQAMFQMGLIHAHPDNPERNYQNAQIAFETIIDKYPYSRFRGEAELWLKILAHERVINQRMIGQKKELRLMQIQMQDLEKKLLKQQKSINRLKNRQKKIIYNKDLQIKEKEKKISDLQRNIDQLKEIDLKIEEKKRKSVQ